MQIKNEHSARIFNPEKDKTYRRGSLGKGVSAIYEIEAAKGKSGGHTKMQAIRFNAAAFTPKQAKAWLQIHGINYKSFHPAKVIDEEITTSNMGNYQYSANSGWGMSKREIANAQFLLNKMKKEYNK